ncbi:MAG: hypothetical protein JWP77_173 [Polaromonas sp.]|jgi:hypothetical protein|nr:hypothetical protein [Polaromonas sp.]
MLLRIIYVSRASSPLPLELKDILASSRKNNRALRVTGAMGFIDGLYLQYLEGEESVVNALYKRIEEDSRHATPKVLDSKPISERAFPGWSMGLLTWNDETRMIFEKFNPSGAFDLYAADAATVDSLVRSWTGSANWMGLS